MGSVNRDFRLQSLRLAGEDIELGGDDVSALVTAGEVGTVSRGISTTVFMVPSEIPAVLTITVKSEDPANHKLLGIYNKSRAPDQIGVAKPGALSVALPGPTKTRTQTGNWSDAHFTAIADFQAGSATATGTYALELSGYEPESVETNT